MKRVWPLAILLCVFCGNSSWLNARITRREVALTIDDLPIAEDVRDVKQIETLNGKLLAALVASRAPAIGFVNERKSSGIFQSRAVSLGYKISQIVTRKPKNRDEPVRYFPHLINVRHEGIVFVTK